MQRRYNISFLFLLAALTAESQSISLVYKQKDVYIRNITDYNGGQLFSGDSQEGPLIVKINSGGVIQFSARLTRAIDSVYWGLKITDVTVTTGGYIYITGYNISEANVNSVFLVKLSEDGKLIWKKNYHYNGFNLPPYYSIPNLQFAERGGESPVIYLNKNQPFDTDNHTLIQLDSSGNVIMQKYFPELVRKITFLKNGELLMVTGSALGNHNAVVILGAQMNVIKVFTIIDVESIDGAASFSDGGYGLCGSMIQNTTQVGYFCKADSVGLMQTGFYSEYILFNKFSGIFECSNNELIVTGNTGYFYLDRSGNYINGKDILPKNANPIHFISAAAEGNSLLTYAQYETGPFYFSPSIMLINNTPSLCYLYVPIPLTAYLPSTTTDSVGINSGSDFMQAQNDDIRMLPAYCQIARRCGNFFNLPETNDELHILTNPVGDRLSVTFRNSVFDEWKLFDDTGKTIATGKIVPEDIIMEYPVAGLLSGLYLLQLASGGHQASAKFIKY